jgi:hypothetical protein
MCTGEVVLPLSTIDLAADDITLWRDIKEPPKGDVLGDLCLSLRYKPQRYVLFVPFLFVLFIINCLCFFSKPPVLVCQIVQCRNLKQMDLGGASDPYVKVGCMYFATL